jgi:ATP-dependent HslUV protease ATP-binding subunit HslU
LLRVENVEIGFEKAAIEAMAKISVELNEEDNIGARRLRTVLDAVLEDINFEAPDLEPDSGMYLISPDYINEKTSHLYQNRDFRKYTL